ncbi:hypothetical protein [Ileibacterium valens]|uniref:hypothetical protein n=1 Tax=Ileibacterium valens TaxID=1862668 RepID=UPI0023544295|nr:hypothetical protein [Ileibacterium valens]
MSFELDGWDIPKTMLEQCFPTRYKSIHLADMINHMAFIPAQPRIESIMKQYPDYEQANGLYGIIYIDHLDGLNIEFFGNASRKVINGVSHFSFFTPDDLVHETMHMEKFDPSNLFLFPVMEDMFSENIMELYKQNCLKYFSSSSLNFTRSIEFLDYLRHRDYPDEFILTLLSKEGKPFYVWARFEHGSGSGPLFATIDEEVPEEYGIQNDQPVSVSMIKFTGSYGQLAIPVHFYGFNYPSVLDVFEESENAVNDYSEHLQFEQLKRHLLDYGSVRDEIEEMVTGNPKASLFDTLADFGPFDFDDNHGPDDQKNQEELPFNPEWDDLFF